MSDTENLYDRVALLGELDMAREHFRERANRTDDPDIDTFDWDHYTLLCAARHEIDRLRAEAERERQALGQIKDKVCGDKHPDWSDDAATYRSRRYIADLCDAALTGAGKRVMSETTQEGNNMETLTCACGRPSIYESGECVVCGSEEVANLRAGSFEGRVHAVVDRVHALFKDRIGDLLTDEEINRRGANMTTRVLRIETTDGNTFYSRDWSYGLVGALERQCDKLHGGVKIMVLEKMTDEEYWRIPASNSSADLFRSAEAESEGAG